MCICFNKFKLSEGIYLTKHYIFTLAKQKINSKKLAKRTETYINISVIIQRQLHMNFATLKFVILTL